MNQQKGGFTLVELIVVITILAILGTIAIMAFSGYSKNARDSARIADISNMKKSLELWILQSGTYPDPTNGTGVTFSGSTIWIQGTFGDTVFNTVGRLEKKPVDQLYGMEYTYSVTNSKKEYELGAVLESDSIASKAIIPQTYAAGEGKAYISGTYNGVLITIDTGNTSIIALPSIILSDLSKLELKNEVNISFVYDRKKNLPASFKDTGLTMTGSDFSFTPQVVWTGTGIEVLNNQTVFQEFVTSLQNVYKNNTVFSSLPEYTNIVGVENTTTPAMSFLKTLVETSTSSELTNVKVIPEAVNGTCGTENGKTLANTSTIVGTGACSTGVASSIVGTGPWNWLCNGSYGGTNASCTADPNIAFTGNGTSASPWKLNVGSKVSCQDYNLNTTIKTSNTPRGSGVCGDGTNECLSNGVYVIDPDGAGGNAELSVYCDMTIDKGGWTLTFYGVNTNLAQNITINDVLVKGQALKTYTSDNSTYPVITNGLTNNFTQLLFKGGNATWQGASGKGAWSRMSMFDAGTTNVSTTLSGVLNADGTSTLYLNAKGWFYTSRPSTDPLGFWDDSGISNICGGHNVAMGKNCPNFDAANGGATYHFDTSSTRSLFVR